MSNRRVHKDINILCLFQSKKENHPRVFLWVASFERRYNKLQFTLICNYSSYYSISFGFFSTEPMVSLCIFRYFIYALSYGISNDFIKLNSQLSKLLCIYIKLDGCTLNLLKRLMNKISGVRESHSSFTWNRKIDESCCRCNKPHSHYFHF